MQGGSQTQSPTPVAGVDASTFYGILKEFLASLRARFPDNQGVQTAESALGLLAMMPSAYGQVAQKWFEFAQPILPSIKARDAKVVGEALDSCDVELIRQIGAGAILNDESVDTATKDSIWKYLQTLTNLSAHLNTAAPMTAPAPTPAPMTASPASMTTDTAQPAAAPTPTPAQAQAQPAATGATATAAKSDPGQIVKGITEAFPKILQSLNDVLKSDQGDNPLAQMMKTMMNPDQVQPGMANNVMANLMQQDASVMAQTPPVLQAAQQAGMTPEDIIRKLQRLENLEKARAKRRGKRSHK